MKRGTVAEIDLAALSRNFATVQRLGADRPVIAVVKADAYGHGAVEAARRLSADGAALLAVAFTNEARELRAAGITGPLLVLFDPDPEDVLEYHLTPVITDVKAARALSRAAERRGRTVPVHLKFDTGMGRLGLLSVNDGLEIAALKGISVDGLMSHFSEADLADSSFARLQIERFTALRNELAAQGVRFRTTHMANSAAVMTLPEAHFDALRPGIMLYGYTSLSPAEDGGERGPALAPVMSVKARLIALRRLPQGTPISYGRTFVTKRESRIGVMSAGYADGLDRRCSNNADVLVRGARAPVVGRVCMDLTMIDLTHVPAAAEGDEAVLIGRSGAEEITAADMAARIGTIPYEVLLSLGSRAKRVYNTSR